MNNLRIALVAALAPLCALSFAANATAQTTARTATPACTPLTGIVRDSTAAVIPGATIQLDQDASIISDAVGHFRIACVPAGHHTLHVAADSFSDANIAVTTPRSAELTITLHPPEVDTTLNVTADDAGPAAASSATASGPSQTISGQRLQSLADDPDDLLRQLQQMSAAAGGAPSNTTISVDGFTGGDGNTTLPPKSSIAYIKVNPDLFSAEYRQPPFGGGQVEIYTKPGQPHFHGALFATNSSSWMNASDPFTDSNGSIGKQRYGFELTGPVRKKGSDFTVNLEHRAINNVEGVYAATGLDNSGDYLYTTQTVPAPQSLFIGNAKTEWQLGSKDTLIVSYGVKHNSLENQGVGGTTLQQAAYDGVTYDNNLRFTNVVTASAKFMNETHIGFEFDGENDTPFSTAPQVSVSGAFTGGGASIGNQIKRELYIQADDDAILSLKKHLIKIGIQNEILHETPSLTSGFNGSYTFAGTDTMSALAQYQSNATPTLFTSVTGTPNIDFWQYRAAPFIQDDWRLRDNLHVALGLRYFGQTNPGIHNNFTPRLGINWAVDKKSTWTVHAHAGMFTDRFLGRQWMEVLREDGVNRVTSNVYNASNCLNSTNPSCDPLSGGTIIHSIRTVHPNFGNEFWSAENIGFTHTIGKGWNLSGDYYQAQLWHATRTENINSPANGQPTGPRPYGNNLNILQLNNSARGYGNVQFMGLEQHSFKHLQFFMGAVRVDIIDNNDDNDFYTPQTTGVNTGEYARRDNQNLWNVFGNATVALPKKLQFSTNFNGGGMQAYNITTGQDNNGDGNFNDRPYFAPAGTPLCSSTVTANCAYQTPWGLLTATGSGATLSRDKGNMPWTFYLDTNLQRTFALNRNAKADHPQMLIVNIRSSNVLNHDNVTAVGGVLGSPLFGKAYAADNGRRVEGGLRYTF